jgi:kynurenine formamidase
MDIRNWGRWGAEDERGALNLLTPEAILRSVGLVRQGKVLNLAIPIAQRNQPFYGARVPPLHLMSLDGGDFAAGVKLPGGFQAADDYIIMNTHSATHVDGLAHAWYDDKLYNGHNPNDTRSYGAKRCGVDKIGSIVGRGVLIDVAGHLGVPNLPREHVVTVEDVEGACAAQGVEVAQADIVLIRTGWLHVFYRDAEAFRAGQPGIGVEVATWLLNRDVAAVGADNMGIEFMDGHHYECHELAPPVHKLLIRDNGIHMMELMNLDELAGEKAWEFLFVAAPLRIAGGVGSPISPLAIF